MLFIGFKPKTERHKRQQFVIIIGISIIFTNYYNAELSHFSGPLEK